MKLEAKSQIIITKDYSRAIEILKESADKNSSFELFIKDDENFLVNDANEVISSAYLASKERIFLILFSKNFSDVVQNRLLKIIEEPPKNKEFILITPSKSTLLPTITSRLPLISLDDKKEKIELNLDIKNLNLDSVYSFIQEHKRLKSNEAIDIVEEIIKEAIKSDNFNLDDKSYELFRKVRVALNLGSPVDFLLTTLLLKLLAKKRKRSIV